MGVHSQIIVTFLNNKCNTCKLKKIKLVPQCNQEEKNTELSQINSEPTKLQVQQCKSVL